MASDTLPKGTIFYNGHGQAGNWSDPANWVGGVAPSAASGVALFTSDATLTSSFSVYQMMMLGTEAISVTGTLNTLSTNLCNSFMICNGAVVTFAPTAVLNDAGGMIVGVNAYGSFTAQGSGAQHATLNSRDGKVGQHQGSHGVMTLNDAVWHVSDRMFVGLSGQGTLSAGNASHIDVAGCFGISGNLGGYGTVSLTGGSTLSVGTFAVIGGNGIDTDTPAPAGTGTGIGTLSVGAGSAFSVAQFLTVSAGSAVNLSGGSVSVGSPIPGLKLSGNLSGFGTVTVGPTSNGAGILGIVDNGLIQSSGGTLVLDSSISGTGHVQIAGGSTLAIEGSSIGVPSIAFSGSNGTLALAHGIADHAVITGFAAGDIISMAGVNALSFNASTDVLTLSSGSQVVETLQFAGTYASNAFTLTQGSAGAMIGLMPHH